MDMQFTPHIQAELDQLVTDTGCPLNTIVNDLLARVLDEQENIRHTLDSRYDDLESGRIEPISAKDVRTIMLQYSKTQRSAQQP